MIRMTIKEVQDEIIEEFSLFDDWMDKYEHLISYGKELEGLPEETKTDDKLVKGCQSKVWLDASHNQGILHFEADSDAVISKGIIGLLIRILSDQPAIDIANAELYAIDSIGLKDHLSPNRANGLVSMVKKMKLYAIAHSAESTS